MPTGSSPNGWIRPVSLFVVRFFLVLLWAAPAIYGADAIWSNCNGPEGGGVNALAIDPTSPQTIYVATDGGGVFKSTDGAESWIPMNTRLSSLYVQTLAIDPTSPQTIYAGTRGGGVFKYTDADGWAAVNAGEINTSVLILVIDPTSPQTIYAGTDGGGVFKSTNRAARWTAVNSGLTNSSIHALVIDPTSPQTIYAGSWGKGVFKSTDGGGSWNEINSGLADTKILTLAVDPASPQTIYAGASGGLFKSTNGGASWNAVGTSLNLTSVSALAIDPVSPQTVFVGSQGGGVIKSTDGGDSWNAINAGLTLRIISTLVVAPTSPQAIYAGTDGGGVFKSTNAGGSWGAANTGLTIARVYALAIDPASPQTIYAGTYGAGAFKSTDGGGSWNAINSGLSSYVRALAIDPVSPQTVYAGTYGGGVYKSTNGGGNWSKINGGLTASNISALAIDPTSPQTIYAGSLGKGVFKSTNAGGSWSDFSTGLTNANVRTLAIDPISPQTVYAGTDGGIYRRKGGEEEMWNLTDIAMSKIPVRALAFDPTSPQTIYAGTWSAGVLKSTDGGSRWDSINDGLGTSPVLALAINPVISKTIYAGTSGGGVSKSTDGGGIWKAINTGLPTFVINALAIDPTSPQTVYAGTYGAGVWTHLPPCSSLSAGGATECETEGIPGAIRVGYAKLRVKSGAAPYGTAVFSLKQNGITVSEAGVPATPPTTSARIFIDYRSGVTAVPGRGDSGAIDIITGIAVANTSSATANVKYTLRDLRGGPVSLGHGTIAAGRHFAKFINQLQDEASDFSLPPNFQSDIQFGSLQIDSDRPLSVLGMRLTNNQRGEALVTTTPTADLTQSLSYNPKFFAQFADGGGYTTSVMLVNTSKTTETGRIKILDNKGFSLVVNQVGGVAGSSFSYSIPAGGAFHFQTDGSPADVNVGWVQLIPDASTPVPASSGVFGYNPGGILLSESGVPAVAPTKHARVFVDLSNNRDTGLAIANLSVDAASITINAFQTDGVTKAGTSQGPLKLEPGGHDAKFAGQFISGLPDGFRGVLDISAATPFAALTVRLLINERHDFLMITFPVADAEQTAPSPIVFPQVADGGGYVTEFILISAGQAAATALDYYDEDGALVDLGN